MLFDLWIMRHATAEDHGHKPDPERLLIAKGRAESTAQGRALAAAGLAFEAVASSPLLRALETTQLVVAEFDEPPAIVEDERLLPEALPMQMIELAEELANAAGDGARILLGGHNPSMGRLQAHLLEDPYADRFRKAAVIGFRVTRSARGRVLAEEIGRFDKPEVDE